MEGGDLYPNHAPVLISTGFNGAIAGRDPDHIPLNPTLINQRQSGDYGAQELVSRNVIELQYRNLEAYPYLRPHKDFKMAYWSFQKRNDIQSAASHYRMMHSAYIPRGLLLYNLNENYSFTKLKTEVHPSQGNPIAGVANDSGDHILFTPTGSVLQRASLLSIDYTSSDDGVESDSRIHESTVETGFSIRQSIVLGSAGYKKSQSSSSFYAATRGNTNCSVYYATAGKNPTLQEKIRLSFPETLHHIASNPHAEAEIALLTDLGDLYTWDSISGVRCVGHGAKRQDKRYIRCEYASHPMVLWNCTKQFVNSVDLRENSSPALNKSNLFELPDSSAQIHEIKARPGSPFQFSILSGLAVEIIDCRMPKQPVISWSLDAVTLSQQDISGPLDDLPCDQNSQDAIVASSREKKRSVLFQLEHGRDKTAQDTELSLKSIRSNTMQENASQYVASNSPLNLLMTDGGEATCLFGSVALPSNSTKQVGVVYQMNSLGDIYSHSIAQKDEEEVSIRTDLPCGASGQVHSKKRKLPIAVDAILPEYDANTLTRFRAASVKSLLRKYPRLPSKTSSKKLFEEELVDEDGLAQTLLQKCRPSATLFRLTRYVNERMGKRVSSSELLHWLESREEFTIENYHLKTREKNLQVLDPYDRKVATLRSEEDQQRLRACDCDLTSTTPCQSITCIIPNALVVMSVDGPDLEPSLPPKARRSASKTFSSVIAQAKEMYNI